jgi:hypothetical protein
MNKTILVCTFIVELALGMCGFISMHLRSAAERRRLARLPTWEQLPFSFKTDYFQDSNVKLERRALKIMRPRSGLTK